MYTRVYDKNRQKNINDSIEIDYVMCYHTNIVRKTVDKEKK